MSLTKVKEHLKKYGLDNKIMEFSSSSATVKEASEVLGCTKGEIAKTLSFLVDDNPIVIVVAGDKKIDNSKYKKEFHVKAKMIHFEDVERLIGHEVGGVCPFYVNNGVLVYLDVSLKKYEYIHPACGSHNTAIKLSIKELEETSNYDKWIDVCKEIN